MNYLLGLSRVSTAQYLIANVLGMLPLTLAFVYIGALSAKIANLGASGETKIRLTSQAIGLVVTIAATFVVVCIARKALREAEKAEVAKK